MFWKKTKVKKQPLDGFCSNDQQIDMYRTLYAKAAKERDEAIAQIREAHELVEKYGKQVDEAIQCAKDALEFARRMMADNIRLTVQLAKVKHESCDWEKERESIDEIKEIDPCDWIKEEQKEERK